MDYLKCISRKLWNSVSIYRNKLGKDFGENKVEPEVTYGRSASA